MTSAEFIKYDFSRAIKASPSLGMPLTEDRRSIR
jgi:hypothetical protein